MERPTPRMARPYDVGFVHETHQKTRKFQIAILAWSVCFVGIFLRIPVFSFTDSEPFTARRLCAVIGASTRSSPLPKLPADSSSPKKGDRSALATVCDRSSRDRKMRYRLRFRLGRRQAILPRKRFRLGSDSHRARVTVTVPVMPSSSCSAQV